MATKLGITEDDPTAESSQPTPKRAPLQTWTLSLWKTDMAATDLIGEKRVNVLASNFRRAAIKADNWVKAHPEYSVVGLFHSPDTVI